jgi:hypothetical protein
VVCEAVKTDSIVQNFQDTGEIWIPNNHLTHIDSINFPSNTPDNISLCANLAYP